MSTTSSVTASGRDQAPSNKSNLKNQMYLFVLTRPDGTPLDVTSMSEEDIMEICIRLGHTHPVGVLCYLVTESVALFCSTEDMQCATHRAIKAMELQDKAIAIRAMAPSGTHIRVYMIAVGGDPSKLLSPPSEGDGESHSPTDNPHPRGETLHHCQAPLGDLAKHKLHQLMEDLCQEIALHELNAPPRSPPPMPWGHPSGAGILMRMTRRSPFWEGEGGFPQNNHPHLLPLHDQVEDGLLRDHLLNLHFLLNLVKMWGTWLILWHWDCTFSGKAHTGKTEMSFEQWNHEVQCVKDLYLELVVWESIVRSPKGAAVDMAQYMGPTASVSNILQKLTVFFRTVALFNVLMQNFYKVTQGNHKKVPSFAMRLEGTLNQIRLKCPRWIADGEVSWHLKDQLFHGVHKHIRDSIRYLYSNPETTYSQLMVTTHKAKSEMEEAKDKDRARSVATTEVVDGSKELGDQIARLIATLKRAEQENCPTSAPNSPRHGGHGRGWMDRNTHTCPSSHNGQTGLVQTTSTCSSSAASWVATTLQGRGNTQGPNGGQISAQNTTDTNLLQCFQCQGWGHMVRECATPAKTLNKDGGNWGNAVKPPTSSSQ